MEDFPQLFPPKIIILYSTDGLFREKLSVNAEKNEAGIDIVVVVVVLVVVVVEVVVVFVVLLVSVLDVVDIATVGVVVFVVAALRGASLTLLNFFP